MATGHIRKRTSSTGAVSYQVVVESERDPITGKRERHYKTVNGTKKQAEATMRKLIAEVEAGGIVTTSAMKTGDWLHDWLKNYLPHIAATTREGYRDKIDNLLIPSLGNIPLNLLKPIHVQSWANDLQAREMAPKTIRNAYNNLNAAMKKAVILRMIPFNPCTGVELPRMKRYQARVYTKAQVQQVLAAAKGTDFYLTVALFLATGMRRGELLALKWENVDLAKNIIHVRENMVQAGKDILEKTPKSEAGRRDITIGQDIVVLLSEAKMQYYNDRVQPGFRDGGYVIRQKNGAPYRPDAMTKKWERFLETNKLPAVRLHDLRHTHATLLKEAGVSDKVLQERLGHSDVSITLNVYTHVTSGMAQAAAEKIESVINF